MSEPVVPPPPPPPPAIDTPKQGLSTGAKIAIGCLVALLLLAGGCFVVTAFFAKKAVNAVKEFSEDIEKDPDAAAHKAAVWAFKMNPELEVVSADDEAKTVTVREKKTGKVVTFDLGDIKEGRLSIDSGGETVEFDANLDADGKSGSFSIDSGRGKAVLGADAGDVPDWIPRFPDARADSFSNVETASEISGTFTIHTEAELDEVLGFYERELKAAGFDTEKSTVQSATARGGNVTARKDSRTVNVALSAQEGETQGLIAYGEKR